ncbi:FadR/GntR family transcriptional regulator [Acidimangrovimonas pyrenivorans]|uniref:FadR/GntR family transcriptional regulator n=1 Tax=Acidimangrovimonas pyrenivorans TaxID=2030798 RepID=A0ABV7AL76_9RHOB
MTENANTVLAQIRRIIDAGGSDADGRLPTERTLCAQLGVGRRELRCALEVLEAEGLIWRRQGKGTFIGQPPDPTGVLAADIVAATDALSVMEARLCIEPTLAALCAERASTDDIGRMRHLAAKIGPHPNSETAEIWDGALHRMIARAAGNQILLTAFSLVDEVRIREDWQRVRDQARSDETTRLYHRQHEAIIDAIEARDPDTARQAMTEHLNRLMRNLEKTLDAKLPDGGAA